MSSRSELDSSSDNTMCVGVNRVRFSSPVDETDKPLLNPVTEIPQDVNQYHGNHGFIINQYFLELAIYIYFLVMVTCLFPF